MPKKTQSNISLENIKGTEHLTGKVLRHIRKGNNGELVFCFGKTSTSTSGPIAVCVIKVNDKEGTVQQILYPSGTWNDKETILSEVAATDLN